MSLSIFVSTLLLAPSAWATEPAAQPFDLFADAAWPQRAEAKTTDFAATWDKVEKAISTRYYARNTRKAEMEGLLSQYGPLAKGAKNKEEFSGVVNAMIRDFKDSHFDFLTEDDQGYYTLGAFLKEQPETPHIGAWFKKTADGYTVQMVLNAGPAEQAGLQKGDLVVSVNGKPFTPVSALKGLQGQKAQFNLKRRGQSLEKTMEVKRAKGFGLFLEATQGSIKILEQDGKKIGYIHVWTMANTSFRQILADAVYEKFKDTDGIILDIRDGFGGRPEGFGDPFFRPGGSPEWKFAGGDAQKHAQGYQKPLVVLINEGSRSAKEVFSQSIKKTGRATLVGTTTAGHVLGTFPMTIDDWAILEIPLVEVITDGVRLEGKGVAPDVEVKPELDENGKDLQLAKAVEVLMGKMKV